MKVTQVDQLIRLSQAMAKILPDTEQTELIRAKLDRLVKEIKNPVIQDGNKSDQTGV